MEAGRSWPDLSSLERVLIQDYWPGLPNTPFNVIQKGKADFDSNHSLNSRPFRQNHISFHAEIQTGKVSC